MLILASASPRRRELLAAAGIACEAELGAVLGHEAGPLPPYEELDGIIERYVERDLGVEDIVAAGFAADTVRRVIRMIDGNEYKRRQAAPGIKITSRAFGRDRRMPIANRYRSF